jgi:hypothetical protein
MTTRRIRRAVAASGLVLAALAVVGPAAPAAHADCVSAEAYYYKSGSTTRRYVVGPKKCVAPTPFGELLYVSSERGVNGLPPGTPNGAGVGVWLTSP